MQLTPPSPEQTWNWKENVRGGATTFDGKVGVVSSYPGDLQDYVNRMLLPQIQQKARGQRPGPG